VMMPTGLDQDHPTARCQPGQEIRFVPIPDLVAHMLGIGVLARADWIINQCAVGAKADNGSADARRVILSAVVDLPAAGGMAVVGKPYAKCAAVPGDQIANPATPFLGARKACPPPCIAP